MGPQYAKVNASDPELGLPSKEHPLLTSTSQASGRRISPPSSRPDKSRKAVGVAVATLVVLLFLYRFTGGPVVEYRSSFGPPLDRSLRIKDAGGARVANASTVRTLPLSTIRMGAQS
jgi:hypothetical protein